MWDCDPIYHSLGRRHAHGCPLSIDWDRPELIHFNDPLAETLGVSKPVADQTALTWWTQFVSHASRPTASVYAGHQFGVFAGQLGDGRAITLGVSPTNPPCEIQVKGGGKTPFSRFGDGRAVLRSSVREYLASIAMAGLGVPTTDALLVMTTGERVIREQVEPGAIIVRTAPSFIRFGHFEHHYACQDWDALRVLADSVIARHWPDLLPQPDRYDRWFSDVVERTARLIAQWQSIGFCHGVMNTDNMSILGLTLDYGPFGMMEVYDPSHICNHSDSAGRYAYDQQPAIGHWNCSMLATVLHPILSWTHAESCLNAYWTIYTDTTNQLFTKKLGLVESRPELIAALFELMATCRMDFTQTFRRLAEIDTDSTLWLSLSNHHPAAQQWLDDFVDCRAKQGVALTTWAASLNQVNPKYVLRNWVAEQAIRAAEDCGDFSVLDQMVTLLRNPFSEHPGNDQWGTPAPPGSDPLLISCSS